MTTETLNPPVRYQAQSAGDSHLDKTSWSIAVNHTPAGTDRVLFVQITISRENSTAATISAITFGGQALTRIGAADQARLIGSNYQRFGLFYLANPPTGNQTLVITFDNSGGKGSEATGAVAQFFNNVELSAPIASVVSQTQDQSGWSESITTTYENSVLLLGFMALGGTRPFTPQGTVTEDFDQLVGYWSSYGSHSYFSGRAAAATATNYTLQVSTSGVTNMAGAILEIAGKQTVISNTIIDLPAGDLGFDRPAPVLAADQNIPLAAADLGLLATGASPYPLVILPLPAADLGLDAGARSMTAAPVTGSPLVIAWRNNFDLAISVTASSSEKERPISNVRRNPPLKQWRALSASAHVDFDAGESRAWQFFALINTGLEANGTVRVQLSDSAPGASDIFDSGPIASGVETDYPHVYFVADQEYKARYGRITMMNPDSAKIIACGRIFGGPCWLPTISDDYGRQLSQNDIALSGVTFSGQEIRATKVIQRKISFTLSGNGVAEMLSNAFEIERENGISRDVVVMLDRFRWPQTLSLYGSLTSGDALSRIDTARFSRRFTVEERI